METGVMVSSRFRRGSSAVVRRVVRMPATVPLPHGRAIRALSHNTVPAARRHKETVARRHNGLVARRNTEVDRRLTAADHRLRTRNGSRVTLRRTVNRLFLLR